MTSSITPPYSVSSSEYFARPTDIAESFPARAWSRASPACGPRTWISPMWLRSKMPALSRTARCSARSESYRTGMRQPAKSVNVAPSDSWTASRAVLRWSWSAMVLLPRPGAVVGRPLRRTAPGRDDLCDTSLCRRLTIPSVRGPWCMHARAPAGAGSAPARRGSPTERPAVPARVPSTVVRVTKEGTTEWPIRIRSPRLVIRPPGDADRDSVIRLMTDPVTREYLGGAVDYASRQALELSPLGLTWGRWVLALAE